VRQFWAWKHQRTLGIKDRENPTWLWILDAVGCSFVLLRRVCWPTLEECYACNESLFHLRSRKKELIFILWNVKGNSHNSWRNEVHHLFLGLIRLILCRMHATNWQWQNAIQYTQLSTKQKSFQKNENGNIKVQEAIKSSSGLLLYNTLWNP
jgi:hypothetical protein